MAPSFAAQRRHALEAAADLLDQLGADQEEPVDVFGAISSLGLWLVFRPLRGILGAVLPSGSGGVMLTTERQPAVQRYTAGHEIGHWLLDQDRLACDTEDDVFRPSAERERVAQLFASYFLMPPPLAYAACARHGVQPKADVRPAQAYLVARDMRVSYEAAIRQLSNLRILDDQQRHSLLQVPPRQAKRELTGGYRPADRYADVWPVDDRSLHHTLDVLPGDEIVIDLPENRTTGYRWLDDSALRARTARQPSPPPPPGPPARPTARQERPTPAARGGRARADVSAALSMLRQAAGLDHDRPPGSEDEHAQPLVIVADDYEPGWAHVPARAAPAVRRRIAGDQSAKLPATIRQPAQPGGPLTPGAGAAGRRRLAVRCGTEGSWTFKLHYAARHDPTAEPAATFTVDAVVHATPAEENRRALASLPLGDDEPPETPA